ncbi:MAG: hypothetical protein IPK82_30180 [Polyangiaceae bacterium]|nr:hypothetical protein [Polyangiaceae bacterium]
MFTSRSSALVLTLPLVLLLSSCGDGGSGTGGSDSTSTSGTGGSGATGTTTGAGATGGTGGSGGLGGSATGGSTTSGSGGSTMSTGGGGTAGATGGTGGGTTTGTGGSAVDYYGAMAGCDMINMPEVLSPDPSIVDNVLDFTGEPAIDPMYLTAGGQAMYAAGNLNASSLYSEIFAYEALYRCNDAGFLKGEADIVYTINGKKTDLLVSIDGIKVGVSVVRAMSFPKGAPYPVSQALTVLDGKLADILLSTANVAPEDAWEKQILAVVAQTPDHALAIEQAWTMVNATNKADTIVVVTVTEGDDDFIYYNP